MPAITLPDGSIRQFDQAVSIMDVANDIGPGLARATLAGEINGELVDASTIINEDAELRLITARDPEGVEVIRHSSAHVLAQAVQRLFPEAQVTIGPVIDNGFYYDFSWPDGFSNEDLDRIASEMRRIKKDDLPITKQTLSRGEAIQFFQQKGEHYKVELIEAIPEGDALTLYTQGEFTDLCRGPHAPSTGKLGVFKLTKLAGAYWRGNSDNEMLQRIYGTAWSDKKELNAYLTRLEEAEKRDHRKLGKQLDLFHMQEEAPGMVFWHDNGWRIYTAIQDYLRARLRAENYQEVNTPELVDISLWEKSGHAEKFSEEMFMTGCEGRTYAIKPMNCPCHVQVYNQGLHSYRDLPMRMAEFGSCHRNEPSGSLHGLMRVRAFVQDDAHIFCTAGQVQSEADAFITLLYSVYADFGFTDIEVLLSTRPEKRVGSDEQWTKAEQDLAMSLDNAGIEWKENPGEGAFYGPKVEFSLRDSIGRVWQCGTLQLDFNTAGRLDATYVDEDSSRQPPVMFHRAILGSLERFIGILIEHYAGAMPAFLAPTHAVIMNITDKQAEYCQKVAEILEKQGFRIKLDLRNEKITYKIREHSLNKIPYLLVVGDREIENQQIAVRKRGNEDLGSMSVEDFAERLAADIKAYARVETEGQ